MSGAAILEIYGANGGLQVSGEQIGFGLSGYGAVTLTDDGQQHFLPTVTATINVQGVNPVLAFRPQAERYVTVSYVAPISGGYAFTLICQSGSPVGLQWWAFDAAARAMLDPTMDDVVAALWDANGVKTFDMAMASAMRVVAAPSFTLAPVVSPPPVGGTLTDQSQVTAVPAGRVWAIAQATLAMGGEQFDTGQYSLQDVSPETGPVVGDDTPPAGAKWRYQQARGYRTMAGYVAPDQIWAGFRIHEETFGQWVPIEQGPGYANGAGNIDYLILDVTDLPSAAMPEPGAVSVSIDATLREVTVSASSATSTISPIVTATAYGGAAPYQYEWYRRQGGGGVGAAGPTDQPSFRTGTANQPPGSTYQETWGCRVTDAQGRVGYSPNVIFRHIVVAIDVTPDPISYANVSTVTNDPIGFAGVPSKQLTGISQPVTLRIERFNYSGTASAAYLLAYKGPSSTGPWTQVASLDARGTATRYADFSMSNGEWFYFYAQAETTSRRKTAAFDVAIWNESAGHVTLASANLAMVVDDDDNFNVVDYDLDPIDWTNIFFDTTAGSYYTTNDYRSMAGINANISVSVQITEFYVSGGAIQNSLWAMQSASRGDLIVSNLGDGTTSATVQPNEQVRFAINIATTGGRREFGFNVYVYNATTGAFIDHFSMSGYVGS